MPGPRTLPSAKSHPAKLPHHHRNRIIKFPSPKPSIRTPLLPHRISLAAEISTYTMAPSAISPSPEAATPGADTTVLALRKTLTSESAALAARFRALFSLKHLAAQHPATAQTIPAIEAIAAAFTSPSALLKHELAYCLGQSGHNEAVPFLRRVLEDKEEDSMCRHEAAEALGALGYEESLQLLREMRDDPKEVDAVRETCEIAVGRIEWEHSEARKAEKLKQRYATRLRQLGGLRNGLDGANGTIVTLLRSTQHHQWHRQRRPLR